MKQPPRPRREAHILEMHGHRRRDPYYWMRHRDDPDLMPHLHAENRYTDDFFRPLSPVVEEMFEEIVSRIDQREQSVPYRDGDFWYYKRYEEGLEYPLYCRRRDSLEAEEEVILDANRLAPPESFLAVSSVLTNDQGTVVAYGVDRVGRRSYDVHLRDLESGRALETIEETTGNFVWAADGRTLFYGRRDPQTLREYRVFRHRLGTDPAHDQLVFEEEDETFYTYLWRSRSKRFIGIQCEQSITSECWLIPASEPETPPRVVLSRERGHEYSVDHGAGDDLFIRTNRQARNFRLVRAPVDDPSEDQWETVVPHDPEVLLEDFQVFRRHVALRERRQGLSEIRLLDLQTGSSRKIKFEEETFHTWIEHVPGVDTPYLRLGYSSLTTPPTILDVDLKTLKRDVRKVQQVAGYDPSRYEARRLMAPAPDGTLIPMSLVYRKDLEPGPERPLCQYGYGAYGITINPVFSASRISLLDRGVSFAIAHVRGGQAMGRRWYDEGKLDKKMNSFTDFVACTEHLIREGLTSAGRVIATGGSAGGLLVGAVVNFRPELYAAVVAHVPFVDVATTMLDHSIPLTTFEFDEWGDPRDPAFYDLLLSYSPYDNVRPQAYPPIFVTAGLHDSQVQYWEPAKWVARLREMQQGDAPILLRMNLDAGHGGQSGRYRSQRETAQSYAFMLWATGLLEGRSARQPAVAGRSETKPVS